jgi:hypothetical protein
VERLLRKSPVAGTIVCETIVLLLPCPGLRVQKGSVWMWNARLPGSAWGELGAGAGCHSTCVLLAVVYIVASEAQETIVRWPAS